MEQLVGVGVADPGDRALVTEHALDLGASGAGQDLLERLDGELVGQRVWAEAGDALDVVRRADDVQREGLLGAGLGDVEAGLVVPYDVTASRKLMRYVPSWVAQ